MLKIFWDTPCTPSGNLIYYAPFPPLGEVAQLVEHHVRNVGVESSNLFFSTIRQETLKAAFVQHPDAPRFFFCLIAIPLKERKTRLVHGAFQNEDDKRRLGKCAYQARRTRAQANAPSCPVSNGRDATRPTSSKSECADRNAAIRASFSSGSIEHVE